ncbi:MAG: N-glycosylase/DNA lyase [Candidatus Diapherotrites archaeon]|nr:N-glycosylase/DNA lyase [Candidatus Diapherotrites archaeon]
MNGPNSLLIEINELKRTDVRDTIEDRMGEFRRFRRRPSLDLFKELCFCILTANFNAERAIRIQAEVGDGFLVMTEDGLARRLKTLGYRYPNTRAEYIAEARQHAGSLRTVLGSSESGCELREWLIKNIKGLGMKESSHFLRNIGFGDVAILDFHILDVLEEHGVVERPKTLTKAKYLEIENELQRVAELAGLTLGELDLYLWYMETGKVLK